MTILLNPKTWVALLAALVLGFMTYTIYENKQLNKDIVAAENTIKTLNGKIETLEAGYVIVKDDIKALDKLAERKDQLIIRETEVRTELEQIPQTIDRPLHDANNFAYAKRVSDHQRSLTESTGSDNH